MLIQKQRKGEIKSNFHPNLVQILPDFANANRQLQEEILLLLLLLLLLPTL